MSNPDINWENGEEIDIASTPFPIEHPRWGEWQTCDVEPNNPHWHTLGDGEENCELEPPSEK